MVKLINGLAKNEGISIWIYDKIEDIPNWAKEYKSYEFFGDIRIDTPSAIDFWHYMRANNLTNWKTIYKDKRKNKKTENG